MRRVLFVCTGNICRSPTADGVLRHRILHEGTGWVADSAGTHAYHVGEPPDPRTVAAAKARGYDLSELRARQVESDDFYRFDLVLAMDSGHARALRAIRPASGGAPVTLFLEAAGLGARDVPDPYYGTAKDFEHVLDLVEAGIAELCRKLAQG